MQGVMTAAILLGVATNSQCPQTRNIVGTWRLASASATTEKGETIAQPLGNNPAGSITYTCDGKVSVLISHGGRKLLTGDRIASPIMERAEAFATFFAYAGTYSVRGNQITHHVQISSVPNWVNTDLVRTFKASGNTLTLTTPPMTIGGVVQTTELRWNRTP